MAKKRISGIMIFGLLGILLSLFCLIFVGLSMNLLRGAVQSEVFLKHFLPTSFTGFSLGICSIFVLKYKNWARIMYLISIPAILLSVFLNINFLLRVRLFVYDYSLSIKLWDFANLGALLEAINIFSFIAALIFFTHHKVKEQFDK